MHIIKRHPRLIAAMLFGVAVGVVTPPEWRLVTRILAGWNSAIWSYLLLMGWLMARASNERVRSIAEEEDESAVMVLALISLLAMISLAAIVFELADLKELGYRDRLSHYIFTGVTVFGSWCMVVTVFTFHYARLFYRAGEAQRPLQFPDHEQQPDYWDFLYFSLTIAVAAQTSDVTVMSRPARKIVLAQSFLSFIFNTAILGLTINIAAGILGA